MSRWRERRHETTLARHREPPGRANARPMTGSAKQSIAPVRHCERSEAIHCAAKKEWIASSLRSSQ